MSLDIAFVTETFPPEVNGVAMTVGRLKTAKNNQSRVITSSAANRDFGSLALKSSVLL